MYDASNGSLNRPFRMGLVGGGGAAFIGKVHAWSAMLDNRATLVAGAFSSNVDRSRSAAPQFGVPEQRAYGGIDELIASETPLPEDERIEFVSIATPNATHFEIARKSLEAGFHVVCDKPMTVLPEEAAALCQLVDDTGLVFALTHNYSGYPMVREARDLVHGGELGDILGVRSNYFQGWLNSVDPNETPDRGAWKSDPKISGPAGALGDIGTHAFHLIRFVTGWSPTQLSCTMRSFHAGRPMDDYGLISMESAGESVGSINFSQMSHGRLNDLTLEVDGTKGSLAWSQEHPNQLTIRRQGEYTRTYDRSPGDDHLSQVSRDACRIPPGHPEGFLEAFANVYRSAFDAMVARHTSQPFGNPSMHPTVIDGYEGVQFMESCLSSNEQHGAWVPIQLSPDSSST